MSTERKAQKPTDATKAAVKKAAARATTASAKLENRKVPVGYVRSQAVAMFLAARQTRNDD